MGIHSYEIESDHDILALCTCVCVCVCGGRIWSRSAWRLKSTVENLSLLWQLLMRGGKEAREEEGPAMARVEPVVGIWREREEKVVEEEEMGTAAARTREEIGLMCRTRSWSN